MPQEPLVPQSLVGIQAYSDVRSVQPGQSISFYVSSDTAYDFSVVRLGTSLDAPGPDDVQVYPATGGPASGSAVQQPIAPGSYVNVEKGIDQALTALTLECWVRPWDLTQAAGVLTQYTSDVACGFGLFLNEGTPSFFVGNGTTVEGGISVSGPQPLSLQAWTHLAGTYDGATAVLYVNGQAVAQQAYTGAVAGGNAPLRIGAAGQTSGTTRQTASVLSGDVAAPVIYSRALSAADVALRFAAQGLAPPSGGVLAYWPFSEERGTTVADASGSGRTGTLVNRGTWGIGGPSFDSALVDPNLYNPNTDPLRGHGIRLASDDLYDCGWTATFTVQVGDTWTPGLYSGRLSVPGGTGLPCDVTFVVRRSPAAERKQILVLCSTATWWAYNTAPFTGVRTADPYGGESENSGAPSFGLYYDHNNNASTPGSVAQQPVYQVGMHVPWPAAMPYLLFNNIEAIGYSHLVRQERFTHVWLQQGYEFDMAADLDLDSVPDLLTGYTTVFICGHSEYWTRAGRAALDQYLVNGGPNGQPGTVIVLAGNVMWWRAELDLAAGVMECRKYPAYLAGANTYVTPGELFYSLDPAHRLGSAMRGCGMPCYPVLGMETLGLSGTDWGNFYAYTATDPGHWLFDGVEFGPDHQFGYRDTRYGRKPAAVGDEYDTIVTTVLMQQSATLLPASPPGIQVVASCTPSVGVNTCHNYWPQALVPSFEQSAEISQVIYWPRPQGGQVVYAGSIAIGWSLIDDAALQTMVANALKYFGVTT